MALAMDSFPLHPILVNFTAALIPVSYFFDLIGRATRKESLLAAGCWTLLVAAAITPLTALAGWLWLGDTSISDHPASMLTHQWLGIGMAVLLIPVAAWRWRMARRGRTPGHLYFLAATVLLLGLVAQCEIGLSVTFATDQDTNTDETMAATTQSDTNPATEADTQDNADGGNEEKPTATQPAGGQSPEPTPAEEAK